MFGEAGEGLQLTFRPAVEARPTGPLQNIFGTTDFVFPAKPRAAKPPKALRRTQFGIAGIERVQETAVGAQLKLFVGGPASVSLPFVPTRTIARPPTLRSGFDLIPTRFQRPREAAPLERDQVDIGFGLAERQRERQDLTSGIAAGLIGRQAPRQREDVLLAPAILDITQPRGRQRTGVIQRLDTGQRLRQAQRVRLRQGARLRQGFISPFGPDIGIPSTVAPSIFIPTPDDKLLPKPRRLKKKKLPRRRREPTFKPSLFGIEIGATISKPPKFVGAAGVTGIRPIVIVPSTSRQPKRINSRSNLPKVMRNKSTMGFINETAVFLGGRQVPKIPTFGGSGRRGKGRRRSMSSLL